MAWKQLGCITDLRVIKLPVFRDQRGMLVPVALLKVAPFPVVRLFWVTDVPAGTNRGGHAHIACRQLIFCVTGHVRVEISDGTEERSFELAPGHGVDVLPGLFASEVYRDPGTVLLVLCDRVFEADDYLDDIDAVRAFRATREAPHR